MALPNTYYLLNYLESTGTQYIDLGIKGNLGTKFQANVEMTSASTSNTFTVFGDNTTTGSAVSFNTTMNTTGRLARFGSKDWQNYSAFMSYNARHNVQFDKSGVYLDGTLKGSFNETATFTTTNNLLLFKVNGINTDYSNGTLRIYWAKVFNDDTLIRDLVPVQRIADNVVGMYDLENDVFYTNAGTGTFDYFNSQDVDVDVSLIPKMTSNTAPYGSVSTTSSYYNYSGATYNYRAFDGVTSTDTSQNTAQYMSENQSGGMIRYIFPNDVRIHKIKAWLNGYGKVFNYYLRTYDGSTWTSMGSGNLPQSTTTGSAGFSEQTATNSDGIVANSVGIYSTTQKVSSTNFFCSEISAFRTVHFNVYPTNAGTISYSVNSLGITLTAEQRPNYYFSHWEDKQGNSLGSSVSYTLTNTADDDEITAVFVYAIITITYDSNLGSASYTDNSNGTITLSATPDQDVQFLGWYINSVLLSDETSYVYTVLGTVTIEAMFEPIYAVTASVNGNGAIQFTRGTDQNDITVSVIPDANHHFVKYTVDGVDNTTTPLQLHLTADVTIVAYFEDDDHFHISCPTGNDNITVYISANDVYAGTTVTLWARPFPDYNFIQWGDGVTTNPRTITVTEDTTLSAKYQRITDTNGIYQYRCFIKDQLHLTDPPKSFLVVDTFDVNVDLLTNATSKITVVETPTNVNEGDVLVLYDPKGQFLYNGVITSFADKTINCSQMQSFYHGSWVYHVNPQTYLEHEIAVLLTSYSQGKMRGSSYTDALVAQRLGGITIDYTGSITSHLPSQYDAQSDSSQYEVLDMEEFIYELYQRYSIIFDFEINFSGTNYVHIKVPTYQKISVGNNMYAVQDMSPVTEVEETNRLIIYSSNNTYRTTYVATKTGIVEAPSSTANRFNVTNTEIVFSDDAVADLVSANLPNTMYNHKVTFNLVIKNFLYEFGEFNLGGELDVYYNDDYYSTVLTGYRISKASNQNITQATFTCGKVRYALTKMLTMGVV